MTSKKLALGTLGAKYSRKTEQQARERKEEQALPLNEKEVRWLKKSDLGESGMTRQQKREAGARSCESLQSKIKNLTLF